MKSTSLIFMPFSTAYSVVTRARLAAYQHGLFRITHPGVPVISVGNITTGGTGKTPLVEWVCRTIATGDSHERKKVCVLTRGDGRANPEAQVVVSSGTEILANERDAGDEPLLLARNLLGVAAVVANRDRLAAAEWAVGSLKTDAFVLDDGFQHLRIARDLNIVTVDATNPWGGGDTLPYGRLREPIAGLARADCIVVTRTDQVEEWQSVKRTIQQIAPDVPVFSSRMVTAGFRGLDGRIVDRGDILSQPLAAFCGVGNPKSFFSHLEAEGCRLVSRKSFPDHHAYGQSDIDRLVAEAQNSGASALITTAKDAIKLQLFDLPIPCYVLEVQIAIDEEHRLVEMIRNVIR
ncbi:MAG: tetraacyldisaccharide 4'-kinase [Acidobacteriota bacterium]|nr:tetraacyldisaccharide 4'-kinase [Acidobacteriota bacterium]